MSMSDGKKIGQMAQANNIKIFPVYQNRYNKAVKKVKNSIVAGEFGKITIGEIKVLWCRPQRYYDRDPWRGTWALDGGALTNQGIHYIDLLQWLLGEVDCVVAIGATQLVNIEVEDTAIVLVKFKNGALGNIQVTTAVRPDDIEASIAIFGEKGRTVVGGIAANKLIEWTLDDTNKNKYSVEFPTIYGFGHEDFFRDVVSEIKNRKPHPISFEEGAKAIQLLNAFYKSIETKQIVRLMDKPESNRLGKLDSDIYKMYLTD